MLRPELLVFCGLLLALTAVSVIVEYNVQLRDVVEYAVVAVSLAAIVTLALVATFYGASRLQTALDRNLVRNAEDSVDPVCTRVVVVVPPDVAWLTAHDLKPLPSYAVAVKSALPPPVRNPPPPYTLTAPPSYSSLPFPPSTTE